MNNQDKVFKTIYDYMYRMYDIPYTTRDSNWYIDLGRNEFEKHNLFEFLKKEFNIKQMPLNYFSHIGVLCDVISDILDKRDVEEKKKTERMEKLNTNKLIIWFRTQMQKIRK
ncbi:MAG: hypothetical protein IKZ49_01720 [Alphaproteobacteria bacterium]|nr:hypothetical protein [Alphaproteobacteria bacterium]